VTGDAPIDELRRALRALTSPVSTQPSLLPDLEMKPDDLAFAFDQACEAVRAGDQELSRSQIDTLDALQARLATMSRDGAEFDPELWTPRAFSTSVHWEHVRSLAAAALEAFGWTTDEGPTTSGA
jgi:hypothetical protein